MRIDKYIWAVRIFKTRSLATKECKSNHVIVNDELVKPSRLLTIDDEIVVKKGPVFFSYKVLDFPKSRVGAKLVPEYVQDITPKEELHKLDMIREANRAVRDKGLGRPTKKDRRALNKYFTDDSEED